MSKPDFAILRGHIAAASRSRFDIYRFDHPDESFYAFELFSDGGVMTVCPLARTEESLGRVIARERERASDRRSLAPSDEADASDLRWEPNDGFHEGLGREFDPVHDWIEAATHGKGTRAWLAFKGRFLAAMMLGLKDLEAEGYFGRGGRRAGVTLSCGVSDDDSHIWLMYESARRLNPPDVFERFWGQVNRGGWYAQELGPHVSNPSADYRAFLEAVG